MSEEENAKNSNKLIANKIMENLKSLTPRHQESPSN